METVPPATTYEADAEIKAKAYIDDTAVEIENSGPLQDFDHEAEHPSVAQDRSHSATNAVPPAHCRILGSNQHWQCENSGYDRRIGHEGLEI